MVPVADGDRPTSVKPRGSSTGAKSSGETRATRGAATPRLDDRQAAVLRVLKDEGCGLTMRQIQARLSWPAGETAPAVQELLRVGLVTKLNTIVPSYAVRTEAAAESRLAASSDEASSYGAS